MYERSTRCFMEYETYGLSYALIINAKVHHKKPTARKR